MLSPGYIGAGRHALCRECCTQPLKQTLTTVCLQIFRVGGGPRAPTSALPIGSVASSVDPLRISHVPVTPELVQGVLGVSWAATPEQVLLSNVAGFILVRGQQDCASCAVAQTCTAVSKIAGQCKLCRCAGTEILCPCTDADQGSGYCPKFSDLHVPVPRTAARALHLRCVSCRSCLPAMLPLSACHAAAACLSYDCSMPVTLPAAGSLRSAMD